MLYWNIFLHHIFTYFSVAEAGVLSANQYEFIRTQLSYAVRTNTESNQFFFPCPCWWVKYLHRVFWSSSSCSSYGVNFPSQENHIERISFFRHRRHSRPAVRAGDVFIAFFEISAMVACFTTTHEDTSSRYRWWMSAQGIEPLRVCITWDVASEDLVFIKCFYISSVAWW